MVNRRIKSSKRGCLVGRAIAVRFIFASHSLSVLWFLIFMLPSSSTSPAFRYVAGVGILLFFMEAFLTTWRRHGVEWKWFCPSVLIYLLNVVPSIWMLELNQLGGVPIHSPKSKEIHKYLQDNLQPELIIMNETLLHQNIIIHPHKNVLKETNTPYSTNKPFGNSMLSNDTILSKSLADLGKKIKSTFSVSDEIMTRILEQLLLLILIIGRWLMPRGRLTHDQLSQLLLIYIGTAADIVEFFDAFKEQQVQESPMLAKLVLAIWSWSLLQFTMVLTAGARNDHSRITSNQLSTRTQSSMDSVRTRSLDSMQNNKPKRVCCSPDVYGIIFSIIMQDAPFLVLRLLLIFKYRVLSYTNVFFTCKNTLVICLLLYRLVMVQIERHKAWKVTQKIICEENLLLKKRQSFNNSKEIIIDYKIAYDTLPPKTDLSNFVIKRHYLKEDREKELTSTKSQNYRSQDTFVDVHRPHTLPSQQSCAANIGYTPVQPSTENMNKRRKNALRTMNKMQKSLSIGDIINMNPCTEPDISSTESISKLE